MHFVMPGVFVFGVYWITLAPTVTGEDSGELITAAHFFGVPHPPGYPLWTLLCGAWTHLIPIGRVAWRANLFSAACMALAVCLLAACLGRLGFRWGVAAIAAVAVGLTESIWSQSVIAEVYTLNLLLQAALMWCVIRWHRERATKWLVAGSLVLGLGMANHHLIGLAALGLGVWVIGMTPRLLTQPRVILRCVAAFALGLTPYFYLLWAGGRDVPVRWGETASLAALWEHVSRGQYKTAHPVEAQIPFTAGGYLGRLYYLARWEVTQFSPVLVSVVVAGMVWMWRRRGWRPTLWLTLCTGAACGPLFHYLGGPQLDRQDEFVNKVFLTPVAFVTAIPLAAGLAWARAAARPMLKRRATAAKNGLAFAAAVLVVAVPLVAHGRANNMRRYWYAHDHARSMLACMLPRAIIFPSGDHNTFPLLYLIHVEGHRPDVTVADKYGYIDLHLYAGMPDNPGKPRTTEERDAIEKWVIRTSRRPVYFTIRKTSCVENARVAPVGLLYHLLPDGMALDTETCWQDIHYRNLEGASAPVDLAAMNIIADYHYALGVRALGEGQHDLAKIEFHKTLDVAWGMKEIHNNVASALADHDQLDEAIAHYETAARMDWRYGPARWNLAKIFQAAGKIDWAAKVFEDLTKAAPGDFRPYGELGFLFDRYFGDRARARSWWLESLRLNPDQPQIIAALADSVDPPPPTTSNNVRDAAGLTLSESTVALGDVVEGESVDRKVTLTNQGPQAIAINSLSSTCGCLTASCDRESLGPGEEETVRIRYTPVGRLGPDAESITIETNDPATPVLTLGVEARIVPAVSIEPARIEQTIVAGRTPTPVRLTVTDHRGLEFKILSVDVEGLPLDADWDRDAFADSQEVTLRFTKSVHGSISGQVSIKTPHAAPVVLTVPIVFATELPVRAEPPMVYLGLIEPGQKIERTLLLIPRDGFGGQLTLDHPPDWHGIEAQIVAADSAQPQRQLQLRVDGDRVAAGHLRETLRIRIEGFTETLEVSIHGFASGKRD